MSEENKNLTPEENEEVTATEEVVAEETVEEIVEDAAQEIPEEVTEDVEEATDVTEEVAEEAVEETGETAEETIEEITGEVDEEVTEAQEVQGIQTKTVNKAVIAGIACVVVLIIAAVVLFLNGGKWFNKYNRKYIDVTGRTIGEVADEMGYDFNDFLVDMELPLDMPENTYESAAVYSRSVGTMAKLYGMSVDDIKSILGLDDEITEETTWGEAYDMATLEKVVGEENLEEFKKEYGFGDEVTPQTKWGEIRNVVDQYERDRMLEEKKAAEEAQKAADDESSLVDSEDATDEVEEAMDDAAKEAATEETAE